MGNSPSVSVSSIFVTPTTALPYLNHALITFRPSTTAFLDGFSGSAQSWMYPSPTTLEGLVAELTPNNWQSRLKSLGATSTEPVWRAVDAHFNQVAFVSSGARPDVEKPDVVYIGRRTSAVVSRQTFTFGTNTAGSVRIRVLPAKYIFADADPAGAIADVTVEADGVLTVTQLADDAVAQLNAVVDFAAVFTASNVAGVVTVVSDVAGYPLIIEVTTSTPGPTMTQAVTTTNVANAYRDDLLEMQEAFETGSQLDPPMRRAYWITDLQGDDVVNAEGFAFAENQADVGQFNPPRDYQFFGWSTTGDKAITFSGDLIGNFDPSAVSSAAQAAVAANGGEGWTRGSVHDHDRYEFLVPALLGRTIGYLPGQVSFTDKVLFGGGANTRMTGRDYGDDESLSEERRFNFYSAEGPRGAAKYGYSPSLETGFVDRKWLTDYATYVARTRLLAWKQEKNITVFDDDTIEAGAGIITAALAFLPAIDATSIVVNWVPRAEVDPNDIAARQYLDYSAFAVTFDIINKIGTLASPVSITISTV